MYQNVFESQVVELTSEISGEPCVSFDPEHVRLEGVYGDQLSAYRAKRGWIDALEKCFLLDLSHDFNIAVVSSYADNRFILRCEFVTACARYAFWRLTNHQAPEAQYSIETAHVARGASQHDEFVSCPDLVPFQSTESAPLVLGDTLNDRGNIASTVREVFGKIVKSLSRIPE